MAETRAPLLTPDDEPKVIRQASFDLEHLVKLLFNRASDSSAVSSTGSCLPKGSPALGVLGCVAVITALAVGPCGAFSFADATTAATSAKAFAPSPAIERQYEAYMAFENAFPRWLFQDNEVFLIQSPDANTSVVSNQSEALCGTISKRVAALGSPALLGISSYFSLVGEGVPGVAKGYVANDKLSMLLVMQVDTTDAETSKQLVEESIKIGEELDGEKGEYGNCSVILAGRLTTTVLDKESTGLGFALGDGIGLPFIVAIFLRQVGSCKLLLLPALALFTSLVWAYAVGKALCQVLSVPDYQVNIMLFLCLAFSIDYSFFMLTRFQEERLVNGRSIEASVVLMLRHGGSIVVVSGGLLLLTWLALAFFPVDGLDAIGYCSAVTIGLCVLSNLVITPCMLLAFPDFFSKTRGCCSGTWGPELDGASRTDSSRPELWHNCYYRLATSLTKVPTSLLVPLAAYAIMAWGASALGQLSLALGVQFAAANTTAAQAYELVQDTAPFDRSGIFATPFAILSQTTAGGLFNESYFVAACELATALANVSGLVPFSLESIAFTVAVSWPAFQPTIACLNATQAAVRVVEGDEAYLYQLRKLTNVANANATAADYLNATASAITFSPEFNPFTSRSVQLVDDIYEAIDEQQASFSLFHPVVSEVAAEQYTVARLPWVLGCTLLLCFATISLSFRAALVPLKLILTVALPIAFVFGLAVCVYQHGALDWLGWNAVASDGAGVSWLLPASTIFILTGLALDYDIFLYARAYELRREGLDDREAICKAVGLTGPVITGAGAIMALAFAGMIVGPNKYLNEFGFIMIVGVLLDTFVVRIILVPCILSLGGWLNWWPVKMPEPQASADVTTAGAATRLRSGEVVAPGPL